VSQQLDRLIYLISKKGLTLSTLADELGISRSTFTYIRSKNKDISPKILKKIIDKHPDIDINYILGKPSEHYKNVQSDLTATEPIAVYKIAQRDKKCASEILKAIDVLNSQLIKKDDQIQNLTTIIINLTSKLS
jgi:transcriptional regulator with XRE-family HTH domain